MKAIRNRRALKVWPTLDSRCYGRDALAISPFYCVEGRD